MSKAASLSVDAVAIFHVVTAEFYLNLSRFRVCFGRV